MDGRRRDFWAGVVLRDGRGEEVPSRGLEAIADVERRLRGRRGSGADVGGAGVLESGGGAGVFEVGEAVGVSALDVCVELL